MENKVSIVSIINDGKVDVFLDNLDAMAASKAYLLIRDELTQQHIKMIKDSGKDNYQKFQDIKIRAKQSWAHDHKQALMKDVDRACMNVYTLILRIFKAHNDTYCEELNEIRTAINRIEAKVGLEPTEWDKPKDNNPPNGGNENGDNENVSDVQGIEENI